MPITIGQRDLEFYEGCVELERRQLRECRPRQELEYRERIAAAEAVVVAIKAYNALTHKVVI